MARTEVNNRWQQMIIKMKNLIVTGDAEIDGNLAVTGDAEVTGDMTITGTLTANMSGGARYLDLGTVNVTDFADGPITLYTPGAGERVAVFLGDDFMFCDGSSALLIDRDEALPDDPEHPPLAAMDSDLGWDSYGYNSNINASGNAHFNPLLTTTGPIVAGVTFGGTSHGKVAGAWAANAEYVEFAEITAAGHAWYASPGGAAGGSAPNWATGFGGTVTDNEITWNDNGALVSGSFHVYAVVMKIETP